jgi:hypothetical protein
MRWLQSAGVRGCSSMAAGQRVMAAHPERDLPFFASFEADPDLAECTEEILASEFGR